MLMGVLRNNYLETNTADIKVRLYKFGNCAKFCYEKRRLDYRILEQVWFIVWGKKIIQINFMSIHRLLLPIKWLAI